MYLFFLIIFILVCYSLIHTHKDSATVQGRFPLCWTTYLKALLPFFILVHHISTQLEQWWPNDYLWEKKLISQFFPFGIYFVGLFFFVSGYGMMISLKNRGGYLTNFIHNRIKKVFLPFAFISIIGIASKCMLIPDYYFWPNCLQWLSEGGGQGFILWFPTVLTVFYIAFYLVFKHVRSLALASHLFALIIVLISFYFYIRGYGEWWWHSNICISIGVYYALFEDSISKFFSRGVKAYYLALTIIILLLNFGTVYGATFTRLLNWVLPVWVVWTSYLIPNINEYKIISFFSSISYEIFLVHTIFLPFLPAWGLSPLLTTLALMAITIPLSWLNHKLFKLI